MSDVKLICDKSFSEVDQEVVDCFIEFQQALIDNDSDRLNEIVLEGVEFTNLIGKAQSKKEFLSQVTEEILVFTDSEILDPTILFDDEDTASLIATVRLTIKFYGNDRKMISNDVASFQKTDGKWHISKWDT
ncbi:MAG: nuclear transport factor 2 family protein [Methanobrevibacter sp.]|uniref:nuclear transport factor 2 family protein n=1 Tax=Methanobrevibacter sp. TaxID=66852 RepID=UPI0025E92024|nr:nuclear transport factor 2 family protein [Methanobrevibacter sp.]MBR3113652.1 nuclear transport factor 2 family protein [Methanobrevibacter sp.]